MLLFPLIVFCLLKNALSDSFYIFIGCLLTFDYLILNSITPIRTLSTLISITLRALSSAFDHFPFILIVIYTEMECYATPWRLWRESWNFLFFIEPSFPFNAPLSLYLFHFFLFFHFKRAHACLQSQGPALSPCH